MKKIILVLLVMATMICVLCGCAKKGICDECGQKEVLNKFVDTEDGEVYWFCDDCYEMAKFWGV